MTAVDRAELRVRKGLVLTADDGVQWTIEIYRRGAYRGGAWWGHQQLAHALSAIYGAAARRPWIVSAESPGHSPYSSGDLRAFEQALDVAEEMVERIRQVGSPLKPRD